MFIRLYLIALPVLFLIDIIWLALVAKNFYSRQLGSLMNPEVRWPAAIIFYLLFIAGLITFVVGPSVIRHSWINALLLGAFFGLVSYATYDLTNLATLKDWPLLVTIVDLVWGMVLSGSVSLATYLIYVKIWG